MGKTLITPTLTSPGLSLVDVRGNDQPVIRFLDQTIGDFLRYTTAQVPDQTALICAESGRQWTYRELLAASETVATTLLKRFQPGDHIATWAAGSADLMLLHLGSALAGLVLVTINPACRGAEVAYMLELSQAKGLFLSREFRQMDNQPVINAIAPDLPLLQTLIYMDEWSAFIEEGKGDEGISTASLPQVAPDSAALILFTSGTTGKPKAAVLRHSAVVNNARLGALTIDASPNGVWLNLLPMFHIGGSSTMALGCMANLGTQVLLSAFTAEAMLSAMQTYAVTITMAVPTMLVAMLNNEAFAQTDLGKMEVFVTGGSAVAPALVEQVIAATGAKVMTLFGQTEASGTMCVTRPGDDMTHITQSVGAPLPLTQGKIIAPDTGAILPLGEIGEICIHSPCTMMEYFGQPDKTAETIDSEGWLHTGDMGYMLPDGYIQITGRLKEVIIRGGENIYPREVEDKLAAHPAIAQSAVFGVPDTKWGEQVAAAVVLKPGQQATETELGDYLTEQIARHKVPKLWLFVDALPLNASGKVQKFMLAETWQARQEKPVS